MRKRLGAVMLAGLVCTAASWAQPKASVSGFVTDAGSGETLLLASVLLSGSGIGVATNNAGYYTLTGLDSGTYTLVVRYIGYREFRQEITLATGEARRLDVALLPEGFEIEEVVVTADRNEEEEIRRIGSAQLTTQTIKQLPTILEPDVFRSLQRLPGVKAASDYSSGLYIRGGSPDQTLILLDRTTVYNPSHVFGFFSTFNPDAIKDVRLYKGGYPAEYGGRLGSVVDIYNKDGNRRERDGSLSIGLLSSRALVEGPYSGGSYVLALRRSTLEPLLAALQGTEGIPKTFYFYDLNGKLNFDASQDNRFSLAFYAGQDKAAVPISDDGDIRLSYGNRTFSTNWTHLFSQRLFSNFTVTGSRYRSDPAFEVAGTDFSQINTVHDVSAKGDFEFIPNERHALKAGFWTGRFTFRLRNQFDNQDTFSARIGSDYASAYVQETYRPTPQWSLQGGVRANWFSEGNYVRVEPRLSLEHRPGGTTRLQLGYGRYYQFLTLITSEVFAGFDTWLTTGEGVSPAWGDQFVAGLKTTLAKDLNLDAEVYYRTMQDLFRLDPFIPDPAGLDYVDLFQFGKGFAYGTEVLLEKSRGRLNGFIGYTLAVTRQRYPNLNEFQYYPPKYDRLHDLNVVVNYDLGQRWRATGVFNVATGQAYTEPSFQYKLVDSPFASDARDVLVSPYNAARLPPYHRLDLGMTRRGRWGWLHADFEWQFQVINVYKRRNIWFYFYDFEDNNTIDRTEVPQIPVPIPNIALTLKF
jgi:hypothetical protein